MSKTEHTPGPWEVSTYDADGGLEVRYDGPDHRWHIATVYGQRNEGEPLATRHGYQAANARRIVACVNACEGIPTKALENGAVADLRAACELSLTRMGNRKADWIGNGISANEYEDIAKPLAAAIAKAVQP